MTQTLADAGKLLSGGPVEELSASVRSLKLDKAGRLCDHFANHCGVASLRMGAHAGKNASCIVGRTDRQQPSFTCQVKGIQPKKLTGGSHGGMNRNRGFPQTESYLCAGCDFMQGCRDSASGWIAQDMQIRMNRQDRCDQGMKRCRVTFQIAVKRNSFATRQDGGAVISDGSTDDDYVGGTGSLWRAVNAFGNDAATGGGEEYAIGFASLRGGTVVGEHQVFLAGPGEHIVLSHSAEDRSIFARGALAAVRWGHGQKPGLYGMTDVLGL